jgi:transposase
VTTLYFKSQKSDELRDFGYSKDRKINEEQEVLALTTTPKDLPIGYTLFPGKTAEVNTLLNCMQRWQTTFPIQNVCVVADRAMMSEQNLAMMEQSSFNYVIAAKLRSLPGTLQETILSKQTNTEISFSGELIKVQEHMFNGRRLIVSYSEERAHKNRSDRERLLARLAYKVPKAETSPKKLVTNKEYLKYFKEQSPGKVVFDESRIEDEARWDEIHRIITNDTSSSAESLLTRYRRLWIIEESFRINKHTLEMRPIFHFKPRRIRAHILLCYVAFAVARYTQRQIATFYEP